MAHVFVLQGDLMALSCDAWLVPGDVVPGVTWAPAIAPGEPRDLPPDFGEQGGPRSVRIAPVREGSNTPEPFLTFIVGSGRPAEWYVDGARAFVTEAAPWVRQRAPRHGRSKHLLALPVVGTGGGGGMHISGDVLQLLLRALDEEAERHDVDIALVVRGGPAFAAAQKERMTRSEAAFRELTAWEIERADRLAARAFRGDLVLFLGAGVSQAAGLPGWNGLLASFAHDRAGITDERALQDLGELDRAAIISRRLGDPIHLGLAVAQDLTERATHYALGHGLLAGLPIDEVITTNYDALFERASEAADRPLTVLPGGPVERGKRWLLKMHGCVSRPETIVLTREDYLRFQENRTAFAGIVQALLITRHMLFFGFSFTDDNFHRIAHAVRQAVASQGNQRQFGTTVVVGPNALAEELWRDDVEWIAFDRRRPQGTARTVAEQARKAEVFLDRLGAAAATRVTHLCDRRYEAVLSEPEVRLRDRLEALAESASPDERSTAAWAEVARLLERLGYRSGQ